MKFTTTNALVALVSLLQFTAALPTDATALTVDEDDYSNGNNTVEERGLFTTYPCKRGVIVRTFKDSACKGSPSRTDIQNWPVSADYLGVCQDVTSKTDQLGIKAVSDASGMFTHLFLAVIIWLTSCFFPLGAMIKFFDEPGCKGKSKYELADVLCKRFLLPTGQEKQKPIKSFMFRIDQKPLKCESYNANGIADY
jgi:hypothetical protein